MKFLMLSVIALLLFSNCTGKYVDVPPAETGIDTTLPDAHQLLTSILQAYVKDGKVNYQGLCEDDRLERYIGHLSATNPDDISDDKDRLAFWLNTYNAFTLKVICDNYPVESINDLHFGGLVIGYVLNKTIWDKNFVKIQDKSISLNYVEHEIIRATEADPHAHFSEVCVMNPCPQAHFALVCASIGCPDLRPEAFEGYKLDQQLDEQARLFFSNPDKNNFDIENKQANLSKILDWFEKDFGKTDEEVLLFVAKYLPESISKEIRANPSAWSIDYTDYDWGLNE